MSSPGKPSRWSRVGSAVRRSTSLLAPTSRPTTPGANDDSSDAVSIKSNKSNRSLKNIFKGDSDKKSKKGSGVHLDTTSDSVAHPAVAGLMLPSAIAESPDREALETAAGGDVGTGPSPLSQEPEEYDEATAAPHPIVTTEEDKGKGREAMMDDASPPESEPEPVSGGAETATTASPVGYVPPPLLDSSAGNPGAFTDDPDSLPQPVTIQDPYASRSQVDLPEAISNEDTATPSGKDGSLESTEVSYGVEITRGATPAFVAAVEEHAAAKFGESSSSREVVDTGHGHAEKSLKNTDDEVQRERNEVREATLPAYEVGSGHDVWAGSNDRSIHGQPFSDPPQPLEPAPVIAVTRSTSFNAPAGTGMPQPQAGPMIPQVMPVEAHRDDHVSGILMPLPPFNASTIAAQPLRQMPEATSTNVGYDLDNGNVSTERTPLLGNPNGYGTANGNGHPLTTGFPVASGASPVPVQGRSRLQELGWLEYHLPDGSFYYVHPTKHVTTDVNLRNEETLQEVDELLKLAGILGVGGSMGEVWLRDEALLLSERDRKKKERAWRKSGNKGVPDWRFGLWRVDHSMRSVVKLGKEDVGKGKGKEKKKKGPAGNGEGEEDQLDMEYRYWSFMEAHPSHTNLDEKAKGEALDVLSWALTDRILPSHRAIPAPFSQEECQELMTLLKSFESDNDDHGIQTRVISRVLLRVAIWRQVYFRPSKPLPKDVRPIPYRVPGAAARRGRPFSRMVFDFVVGAMCLGIPYLFIENRRAANDWEDGRYGTATGGTIGSVGGLGGTGVFVVGACTCLVAAIVLSTSITYLSLPEVGGAVRIAGMCAVLFASFAMASSLVAFFRYRAEMDAGHVGGVEGLVGLSKRAVVLSLPLVFLAYSIIACVVGIALYVIKGGIDPLTVTPPAEVVSRLVPVSKPLGEVYEVEMSDLSVSNATANISEEAASRGGFRWALLGFVGCVGGVLTMSWIVSKN